MYMSHLQLLWFLGMPMEILLHSLAVIGFVYSTMGASVFTVFIVFGAFAPIQMFFARKRAQVK